MSDTNGTQTPGRIITFYSYKGGTGRSMALANVACLLAQGITPDNRRPTASGQRTLVIDWDLEAPGLHRYFGPFLPGASETSHSGQPGLIDLFVAIEQAIEGTYPPGFDEGSRFFDSVLEDLDVVGRYCITTSIENLYFMKAGRFDEDYRSQVNNFRWDVLHERAPWLVPALVRYLSRNFSYVLIDSRTGITDTSGICTMLMPELLVLVFTPNLQSLEGGISLIREAVSYRKQSADLRPFVVFPLPSRVEAAKPELLKQWRKGSEVTGFLGFQVVFESAFEQSYSLESCDLTGYFDEVQVQHVPDYAYGEQIAVVVEETDSRLSLRRSYESFTRRLIGLPSPWTDPRAAIAEARIAELCKLGAKELDENNTPGAQRHYSHALDTYLVNGKLYIPELAGGLHRLGSRYLAEGELGEAETALRHAVEVAEQGFGPDDLGIGDYLESLGDVLTAAEKAQEALEVITRVLNLKREALGHQHPSVADLDDKLGALLASMGRLEESRSCLSQSLAIRRKIFGPTAPAVAASLARLADTAAAMGSVLEAEEYLNEALRIGSREDQAAKANILGRLGWLNLRKRNLSQAEQYFGEAIGSLDPLNEDADTADIFDGSAQVAIAYGDFEQAQTYYERAQLIRETELGPSHPETLRSIVNLGDLAAVQDNWGRANTHYRRALSLAGRTVSKTHPLVGEINLKLGEVAQSRHDYAEAEHLYLHAISIYERLGDEAGISGGYRQLGTLAQARGDYDRAEGLYRQSLEIDERLGDQAGISGDYRLLGALAQARQGSPVAAPNARWRVFVSHTSELRHFPKGRSYVAAAERAIAAAGHVFVDMSDFAATDPPSAEVCRERVQECDIFVALVGTRYGSLVKDIPDVSFPELEFNAATEAGLDRLVFLLDTDAADVGIPLSALIDQDFGARQETFRRRIREAVVAQEFADPATLGQLLERSLRELTERQRRAGGGGREVPEVAVVGEIPQEPLGFQPRADLLAALEAPGPGTRVVYALTGMRGVGKTQLAAAYARAKLADRWRLVAWVNATDPSGVLAGLDETAGALGLRAEAGDAQGAGQAVRQWLESDGEQCLVVFDNATDPEVLRPFLPASGQAWVIITSNRPPATSLGAALPVDVFSEHEALTFLAVRTGHADTAGARMLAAELGHLPLALAQAAAVIASQHQSYGSYLDQLRRLPAAEMLAPLEGSQYPRGVAAAILLSLDNVHAGDDSGKSAAIMDLLSVLSPAGVDRSLLHEAGRVGLKGRVGPLPPLAPEEVDRVLGRLAGASLVTFSVDGSTVSAHRLVMRVIRENLAASNALTTVCKAATRLLDGLAESLRENWHEDRTATRDLVEQIMALDESCAAGPHDSDLDRYMMRLRSWAVWLLDNLADSPAQTIPIGERLVAEQQRVLGPDHPDTLVSRGRLANAYRAVGQTGKAIPIHEQTLATQERVLGPDHPDTLASRGNLANAYREAGRTNEAIALHEQTLADQERVLGPDHPGTLASRNYLANAYREAGRTNEAIALHEQTLADRERILGPDHPGTLASRGNLANAYRDAGRTDQAIALHEQTLADRERILGPDHPDTAASRGNLANAYRDAGRTDEAEELHRELSESE